MNIDKLSLKKKIVLIPAVIICLIVIQGVVSEITVTKLNNFLEHSLNEDAIINENLNGLLVTKGELARNAIEAGITSNEEIKKHTLEKISTLKSLWAVYESKLDEISLSGFEKEKRDLIKAKKNDYFKLIDKMSKAGENGKKKSTQDAIAIWQSEEEKVIKKDIEDAIEDWLAASRLEEKEMQAKAKKLAISSVVTLLIVLFSAIAVSLIFGFLMASKIAESLKDVVMKLEENSNSVTNSAVEVATQSEKLSQSAADQASALSETSSSLEEVTGMVGASLENIKSVSDNSQNTKIISNQAIEMMAKLSQAMKEIKSSNDKIEILQKIIENISEKTEVMDEIVFQTKLLSFNASVEAERAGEHGRGFAVVAQEVGSLAQMSGKAAQEIASIVKDSIRQAQSIIEENRKNVELGTRVSNETGKILISINEGAIKTDALVQQLVSASNQQNLGIKQIEKAIHELDKTVQGNAASSATGALSADELSKQANNMFSIVNEVKLVVDGGSEEAVPN